jgi:MFS family permease
MRQAVFDAEDLAAQMLVPAGLACAQLELAAGLPAAPDRDQRRAVGPLADLEQRHVGRHPARAPAARKPAPPWLVVAIACLASFMVVMDGSIMNVALPAMQRDLHLSPEAQQWVIDAYLLSFGGCMLLAARAAQGLGAAVLATSSMTLVMAATHHDKQARASALSWWAALNSAGFALGVVIGGWCIPAAAAVGCIGGRGRYGMAGTDATAAGILGGVLGPTLAAGAGLGMVILAATHAVRSGVPVQGAGMASGLANTARQLGGALGVAALATLLHSVVQAQPESAGPQAALLAGSHVAFLAASGLALLCGLISLRLTPRA